MQEKLDDNDANNGVIVLLDPVTEWKSVLEAALKLNYRVMTVQLSPISKAMRAFFPTESALLEAGACRALDLQDRDVYSCVQALQLALKQHEPPASCSRFKAVIPLSETAVDFSDAIASMLGLDNYNPLETVLFKRDKGFMKEAVAKSGLKVAKFARIWTQDEFVTQKEALSLDYPVVIKTPQGFSTKDVYICSNLQDAQNSLTQILSHAGPDGRTPPCALLEEYIGGTEFAVNILATTKSSLMVSDVWIYDKTDTARYNGAELCDPNDPNLEEICDYAKGVAAAVGVHYGAAHVEVKAQRVSNDDGSSSYKYTNPVMMEIGARLSGGRKAAMIQAVYQDQWDPFQALIASHLGELHQQTMMKSPPLHAQHLFLPVEKAGRIRQRHSILDNEEKAEIDSLQIETLHSHFWLVNKGDHVQKTTDITSCAGFVWLVGDKSNVKRDADLIMSTFRLEFEEDEHDTRCVELY